MRPTSKIAAAALAGALAACIAASCEDPVAAQQDIVGVAAVVNGHDHRATIAAPDILNPPPGGVDLTSTVGDGHTHSVELSEGQLRALQQPGAIVDVTSNSANSHSHIFAFLN